MSPARRREIASFARSNRLQLAEWGINDAEVAESLIKRLRAVDPDLAAFVRHVCRMPFRYQIRMEQTVTPDEWATIRGALKDILCK